MEVRIKRTEDFTPKWNGNEKDKSPIVFHLRYLSTGEMDECIEAKPTKYNSKTKKFMSGEIVHHDNKMFRYATMEIDNLEVNDGSNTTKITTPEELLRQPGFDLLYYEVLAHIKLMSPRVDSKN